MTKICLTMIVKDGADNIARCIQSALPVIDRWCVVDTGSTDGTQDIVRRELAGIPGELHERPWHNFAHNRSEALELAAGDGYCLMLDADHELLIDGDLPDLAADAYLLRIDGPMEWRLPLLTKASKPFRYHGAAHSYLDCPGVYTQLPLDTLSIRSDGVPTRAKLERDAILLAAELDRDPGNSRACFYLAQSLRDTDRNDEAADMYRRRARMGGFAEEVFWSIYQEGLIRSWQHFETGVPILLEAWQYRPTRVEPLYVLARGYANMGDTHLASLFAARAAQTPKPDDRLFLLGWMYEPHVWQPFLQEVTV